MPTEIYLVKAGMTMSEGMVEEWYVPDGGHVEQGQLLYRMETEKINLDVDADATGTVRHLVPTGVMLEPGAVVGFIYAAGEAVPDTLPGAPDAGAAAVLAAAPVAPGAPAVAPSGGTPARGAGDRILASPAARRLARELGVTLAGLAGSGPGGRIVEADVKAARRSAASAAPATAIPPQAASARAGRAPTSPIARRTAAELGVDLAAVQGSGPGGRITREDVERAARMAAPAAPAGMAAPAQAGEVIPVKGIRRTTAMRMHQSLMGSAQLTMDMDVVMTDTVRMREQLIEEWQAEGIRPTYTDIVVRAVAKALRQHPLMNSEFRDTEIVLLNEIHVGLAVAIDAGLVVPVVRRPDQLSLKEIAAESARLAALAREAKLGLDDMAGGTFTVTALGMYGVDAFTPILNAPQTGILGVNRIYDGVGWEGETPVKRKTMRLSLTWDHRVLDGAPAARFLGTVRDLLEAPFRLLV
jgi:pyruvate dehydrogenase E2 component (dihydrolipoamide acetyltransferase)